MPEEEAKDAEENAPAEQGDEQQGEESASETDEPQALAEDAELEAAIAAVRGNKDLPRPPYPTLPNLTAQIPMAAKVQAVQTYIEKLQYNFTGVNYFDVRKQRPMGRIMETAREITRQALPIKCVEAVFLGTYLTQARARHAASLPRRHSPARGSQTEMVAAPEHWDTQCSNYE